MNLIRSRSRKSYGILRLSPAFVRGVQLEWSLIERPAASARFLNFPLAGEAARAVAAAHAQRRAKRPLAA